MAAVKNLFFDEKTGRYYCIGESICNDCGMILTASIYFIMSLSKKKSFVHEYCLKCAAKNKDGFAEVKSSFMAIITDRPPLSSVPVVLKAPEFTNRANTFEAATLEFDKKIFSNTDQGYKIVDNTKIAGRESWEGASIGAPIKEREITADDALKLLEHDVIKKKVNKKMLRGKK